MKLQHSSRGSFSSSARVRVCWGAESTKETKHAHWQMTIISFERQVKSKNGLLKVYSCKILVKMTFRLWHFRRDHIPVVYLVSLHFDCFVFSSPVEEEDVCNLYSKLSSLIGSQVYLTGKHVLLVFRFVLTQHTNYRSPML